MAGGEFPLFGDFLPALLLDIWAAPCKLAMARFSMKIRGNPVDALQAVGLLPDFGKGPQKLDGVRMAGGVVEFIHGARSPQVFRRT